MDKLIKISSITKKIFVALLGSFLLVFLLFHMAANLMILAKDGGQAYSAFCHFMSSNIFVKIAEIVLLVSFAMHALLSVWLWYCNRKLRPVGYHMPSRTRTAKGSKLAIVSGSLLLVCLVFHFYDFYFVKKNIVKGTYMVKIDQLNNSTLISESLQDIDELTYYEYMNYFNYINPDNQDIMVDMDIPQETIDKLKADTKTYNAMYTLWTIENILSESDNINSEEWLKGLNSQQKEAMEAFFPEATFEPDFYAMAREKFSVLHIVIGYLVFFFVVGLHIRHGFESAFQTFGLNHYKYSRLVEILGIIYCWVVCIGFAIVPLGVYLGL